jgi:hypothetical protein
VSQMEGNSVIAEAGDGLEAVQKPKNYARILSFLMLACPF